MTITWSDAAKGFGRYLRIERSLSPNSVAAYLNDVRRLEGYVAEHREGKCPAEISYRDLADFLAVVAGTEILEYELHRAHAAAGHMQIQIEGPGAGPPAKGRVLP